MMVSSRGTPGLRTGWAAVVEAGLEAGRSPLFQLGAGLNLLENLPTLVALHAFALERQDVAAPTALIGGQAVLWLAALMHAPGPQRPPATQMKVIYSGPDLATQIAVVGALAPSATGNRIPTGYTALLAPAGQAGAPLWATLPFQLAQRSPPLLDETTPTVADQWLAWAGVGLTLLLVLLALLL